MTLHYCPPNKIILDSASVEFGEPRGVIRAKPGFTHKETDKIILLGEGLEPLNKRRDIYDKPNSAENFLFLNYDKDDFLIELEGHRCAQIQVSDFSFNFEDGHRQNDFDSTNSKINYDYN